MTAPATAFAERLAAFRAAHPELEAAEIFIVDLNGIPRGKLVPAALLDKLARGGMRMPTSTLGLDVFSADVEEAGIALAVGDPDGRLVPVLGTLAMIEWARRPTAQVQCMVTAPGSGEIAGYDPRGVLAGVAARAAAMGLRPVMALELEFYLIDPAEPLPPADPRSGRRLSRAQLNDLEVMRAFEPVIAGIARAAEALGAPAETALCEFGPGQFEINLRHVEDPLIAADHLVALRRAVRGVARAHGLDATFMAKPFGEMAGSGMHIHLSLLDREGRNVFDNGGGAEPNETLRRAVAGLLAAMPDSMLIFAPHANSYRRFLPGSYAPVVAAWGIDNRSTALRVAAVSGPGARIEHRVAGADANPYLLAAAVLAGALEGIESRREPPSAAAGEALPDAWEALPLSWLDAERRFATSDFVAEWLGAEFRRVFAAMKRQERVTLLRRVPDTEYDAYLRTL